MSFFINFGRYKAHFFVNKCLSHGAVFSNGLFSPSKQAEKICEQPVAVSSFENTGTDLISQAMKRSRQTIHTSSKAQIGI